MLKFSEIFEFLREISYFERIRMVRMVRMVRSLADRTFQLWLRQPRRSVRGAGAGVRPGAEGRELAHLGRKRSQIKWLAITNFFCQIWKHRQDMQML